MTFSTAMQYAVALAHNAKGHTFPNPCVGAVLVKNGQIVAEGWHKEPGLAHAEVACLNDAKEKGVSPSECTLVVTLEPCTHDGKTPPCTTAVLAAGIKHVVIGALDPTMAGGGAALLRHHGVTVESGVELEACLDLIDDFLTWQKTEYPYLTLKLASTLDGRIASRSGHSKWITSPETRACVQVLRSQVQAVIVGGNTFYQDDPKLTCRLESFIQEKKHQPLAVIATSRLPDVGASYYLLRERPDSTVFWTTVAAAASPKAEALRKAGIKVIGLPSKPSVNARGTGMRAELQLEEGLKHLRSELQCSHVLCEGGGKLGIYLLERQLARELHLHLAPKILGDNEATPLFDGRGPIQMDEALNLRITETQTCASDLIITLRPLLKSLHETAMQKENK